MKSKKNFTLTELLIVIAIIMILSGILLAALGGASNRAETAKVKTEIKNLQNAIAAFQLEYNKLPKPLNYDGKALDDNQMTWLVKVLSGEDLTNAEKTSYGNPNTKKKKFYSGEEKDYWGGKFQVVFEKSYDKGIAPKDSSSNYVVCGLYVEDDSKNFKYDVIVWSKGPDKSDDKSAKANVNEDNVYCMDTQWNKGVGHIIQK